MKLRYLFFYLLFLSAFNCMAQPAIETIEGKKYYVHLIESGQTLYSLHKKYNVSIDEISSVNPGISDGLSIGEKVLIPINFDNSDFYSSHVIEKGETLYGISRIYKCKVSELKSINPELKDGIQIGQVIKVPKLNLIHSTGTKKTDGILNDEPVVLIDKHELTSSGLSDKDTLVKHKVLAHETLYSIAKRYMVTADTIRKLNKINLTSISEGQELFVPVKKVNYKISENRIDKEIEFRKRNSTSIIKKNTYKIALFLPLMYTGNKTYLNKPLKLGESTKLHPYTNVASDFYLGFKLALDSLSKAGFNAEVFIYDTERDSNAIKTILSKSSFNDIDMIFGPFFTNTMTVVARYAKNNQVPMIIPFKSNNQVLYQNPYIYKTTASNMKQIDGVIDFVKEKYKTNNIVMVKPYSISDKALFERAKSRYNSINEGASNKESNIITIGVGSISGKEIDIRLRKDTINIVIVPSTDVKFVTSVFIRLNNVLNMNVFSKDMEIIVFGLEDWNNIEDIDLKHRMRMQQHYASYRFIDYNSPKTLSFIKSYRDNYGTDPNPKMYGVQGFDVGFYFLSALYKYGLNFDSYLSDHNLDLVQNKFEFSSITDYDGKENSSICIIKYEDYKLKLISW